MFKLNPQPPKLPTPSPSVIFCSSPSQHVRGHSLSSLAFFSVCSFTCTRVTPTKVGTLLSLFTALSGPRYPVPGTWPGTQSVPHSDG